VCYSGRMSLDEHVADWHPDPVTDGDDLAPAAAGELAATLGTDVGDLLPPLWHWVYFREWLPQADLGPDGHPADGHFLPPLPDRRRMIAGGRLAVRRPLVLGRPVERTRRLGEVTVKRGRTGEMVFVTVHSGLSQDGELCAVEEQDVVYRSGEDSGRAALNRIDLDGTPSTEAELHRRWRPDPVLLFRFSALTANAHRIHYDHEYVTGVEGYPGLVVHGPLLVLLMLELVRDREVATVSYRLRRPVFAGEEVLAEGGPDGALRIAVAREPEAATAQVSFR
jgi:hydroxyacyl-ACP dehydratase HTD2-like protein with hotdog domain